MAGFGSRDAYPSLPRRGDRVRDSNAYVATVRYVGPVCSAKDAQATWVGVEFDDPTRGKHDGAAEGSDGHMVRYFSLEHGGSGSFLKPDKVDRGVSFVEALRAQYVALDAPLEAPGNVFGDAFAQTNVRGGRKPIEFYGETKIRRRQQVKELECCTLREAGVSRAGDAADVAAAAGHFTGLDLKSNLLSDWGEAAAVARCLPALQRLDLGGNRMRPDSIPAAPALAAAFASLRVLAVNACGLTSWKQVAALAAVSPLLEELYIAGNDLSDILEATAPAGEVEARLLPELRCLDASETRLSTWRQVEAFGRLPWLASLSLNHNAIAEVAPSPAPANAKDAPTKATASAGERAPAAEDPAATEEDAAAEAEAAAAATAPLFPALESLALSGNPLSSWASIDRLAVLPALRALRLGGCPCAAGLTASETRAACVARLPGLGRFNASDVTVRERNDAEKTYVRAVARELADAVAAAAAAAAAGGPGGDALAAAATAAVEARHPRYKELLAKHGAALAPGGGAGSGGTGSMAAEMLAVRLLAVGGSGCGKEPVSKRLPASLTVKRLKQLCQRLFGVAADQQVLYFRAPSGSGGSLEELTTPLDEDDRPLSAFGLCDGCEVFVNEVDERAAGAERRRLAEEAEERMARDLRRAVALDTAKRGQVAAEVTGAARQAVLLAGK